MYNKSSMCVILYDLHHYLFELGKTSTSGLLVVKILKGLIQREDRFSHVLLEHIGARNHLGYTNINTLNRIFRVFISHFYILSTTELPVSEINTT